MSKPILTAFWSYDLFPYVLSGTATKTGSDTNTGKRRKWALVPSYGATATFYTLAVIRGPRGVKLAADLKALEKEHYRATVALKDAMCAKLRKFAPFVKL